MKHLLLPAFAVLLSSCIDPYMMNMGVNPYADPVSAVLSSKLPV